MEIKKSLRGRPRKNEDANSAWELGRAAYVMSLYDEAREKGEKHSAAVRQAVDYLKQHNPQVRISETEVKRVLAKWRPRGCGTILRFERSTMSEEDSERNNQILQEVATLQRKMGLKVLLNDELPRWRTRITARFGGRPDYPRHNRKTQPKPTAP